MSTRQWRLIDPNQPLDSLPAEVATRRGLIRMDFERLRHGVSNGIDMLTISGMQTKFALLPTRGMGIWRAWSRNHEFGWQSPVNGPVHPNYVPVHDPNGLGWLEGFDELLVRCGLQSNGSPEFDEKQRLQWPLHGRVANLPAHQLSVAIDDEAGWIEVTGVVREARLFFANFELTSRLRMDADGNVLSITDEVVNRSAQPAGHQMLYHLNFGKPVLNEGARFVIAAEEMAPRNAHAAKDIDTWDRYLGPTPGYAEQVYFFKPRAAADHWSKAVVVNSDGQSGFGVEYDTQTLPWFVQWKNTAADVDGYVTGLEPATNFPNPRSFEEQQGRVVQMMAGDRITHRLKLHLLSESASVEHFETQVRALGARPRIETRPRNDWSA